MSEFSPTSQVIPFPQSTLIAEIYQGKLKPDQVGLSIAMKEAIQHHWRHLHHCNPTTLNLTITQSAINGICDNGYSWEDQKLLRLAGGFDADRRTLLMHLPTEIQLSILGHSEIKSIIQIRLACRQLNELAQSPAAKTDYLIREYGKALVLFYSLRNHRKMFSVAVAEMLVQKGALVSRYL
jgi:hypothetical protein